MASPVCKRPIKGYRARNGAGLTFKRSESATGMELWVPCGQCIGCRLQRSSEWALRMKHEARYHEENCFLTLTYNDENLPPDRSLEHRHVQLFLKRLRKSLGSKKIKYFCAGEYGDTYQRPHYHLIVFGHNFSDRVRHSRTESGHWLFQSDDLDALWRRGFSLIGDVTYESAQYCAKYCLKKVTGKAAEAHYNGRKPDYAVMSNGIGKSFVEEFNREVYPSDEVIHDGSALKVPRYYDKLMEEIDAEKLAEVKKRRRARERDWKESTEPRLEAQAKVLKARTTLYGDR